MTNLLDQTLVTIGDWVRWGASEFARHDLFYGHGTDNSWDEANLLVASALKLRWQDMPSSWTCHLLPDEKKSISALLARRINERIPAAYLIGEAWFAGLCFNVSPDVLVPRSPIAELIAHDFQPWLPHAPSRILDLCTGSGCIGIACAAQFAHAEVILTDISEPALDVARSNIRRHDLDSRVSVLHSDVFAGLVAQKEHSGLFDLIVTNPPYVDRHDVDAMPAEFHQEPRLGLVAGEDGLDIVRRILHDAADFLNPDGLLVVEVGNSWPALEQAYPQLDFIWPEFEHGGHGVFLLHAEQLKQQ